MDRTNAQSSAIVRLFFNDRAGLAVTESAFFIPLLLFAAIATFDIGRAGVSQLEMQQALRAGAQVSMINITEEEEILLAALTALGEDAAGSASEDGICRADTTCIDVAFTCECTDGSASSCSTICTADDEPPSAFLSIMMARRHEGILVPDFELNNSIVVQTR